MKSDKVRDHLANERTFLAWIRTALGLLGLGFVLARMGLFLRQIAITASNVEGEGASASAQALVKGLSTGQEFLFTGIVFLVIGTMIGGWSAWIYRKNLRAIDAEQFEPALWPVVVLTGVVVLGGLVVIGLVCWRVVGG